MESLKKKKKYDCTIIFLYTRKPSTTKYVRKRIFELITLRIPIITELADVLFRSIRMTMITKGANSEGREEGLSSSKNARSPPPQIPMKII